MKQIISVIFIFFIIQFSLVAQNLVPNYSFEQYDTCPNNEGEVYLAKGWNSFRESPDYFNSCDNGIGLYGVPSNAFGYRSATTGNAYCGLFTYAFGGNYREFIGGQLLSSLIIGEKYYVSIEVSLSNNSDCASNNIGVTFSNMMYNDTVPFPINNQAKVYAHSIVMDTTIWTIISGSFIADSNYKYIVIGNFFKDDFTDTVPFVGPYCNAYYYVDDICVSTDSLECNVYNNITNISHDKPNIYPNPANDKIYFNYDINNYYYCTLTNTLGIVMKKFKVNGISSVDISSIPNGIYFLEIHYNNNLIQKKQIIIH